MPRHVALTLGLSLAANVAAALGPALRPVALLPLNEQPVGVVQLSTPSINRHGEVAFASQFFIPGGPRRLSDPGQGSTRTADRGAWPAAPNVIDPAAWGLYLDNRDGLTRIVRQGDAGPGGEPGATIARFVRLQLNADGDIAWVSVLEGDTVNRANDIAYYTWRPDGGVRLIAREGAPATSFGEGIIFETILARTFRVDDSLFFARLRSCPEIGFTLFRAALP